MNRNTTERTIRYECGHEIVVTGNAVIEPNCPLGCGAPMLTDTSKAGREVA